jgi:hypothetical protein
VCDSSATSTSSRFNANRAEVFALLLLSNRDCGPVQSKLNKTAIELKRRISCKLLTLLGHELCLV